jgi:hypothetical protein
VRLLLLKRAPETVRIPGVDERPDERAGGPRIRCPRCGWEPGRHDLWTCTCFHSWNTFATRGVCPACSKKWTMTQCPRCGEWSPHEEWYVEEPG